MSKVLVSEENLTGIANAIREKNGSQETYTPSEMATAISNISGGSEEPLVITKSSSSPGGGTVSYFIEKLPTINVSVNNCGRLFKYFEKIKEIEVNFLVKPTTCASMFDTCLALENITFDNFDTSELTNTSAMFNNCRSLTSIINFDTSHVTSASSMFSDCRSLTSIPNFDISNITNTNEMFNNCQSLTSIPNLNTSKVTSMYAMFGGCTNLVTLPVLNTSKVTNMRSMFGNGASQNLSDESLNNILIMCINATSYTAVKSLYALGFDSTWTPASKIQALPKYQDFLDAGWTIGY